MKYTPKTHAVRMVERLLGCEDWVPPNEIVDRLYKEIEDYNNIYSIACKLRDLKARNCYGHEHLLSYLLTGNAPFRLTPESQKNLERDFVNWWTSDFPRIGEPYIIQKFVEDWLKNTK